MNEIRINEGLSAWTQGLLGIYSVVICKYIHMWGVEDKSKIEIPIIIKLVIEAVEKNLGYTCFLSKRQDKSEDSALHQPWTYLFFRIGKMGIGPRELENCLPKIKESQLEKLGLTKETTTLLFMNNEYEVETNIYYNEKVGLFDCVITRSQYTPRYRGIDEKLSIWTKTLICPPTRFTIRISRGAPGYDPTGITNSTIRFVNEHGYLCSLDRSYLSTDPRQSLNYLEFIIPDEVNKIDFLSWLKSYSVKDLRDNFSNIDTKKAMQIGITDYNDESMALELGDPLKLQPFYLPGIGLFNFTGSGNKIVDTVKKLRNWAIEAEPGEIDI